jgi:hypothetical protein
MNKFIALTLVVFVIGVSFTMCGDAHAGWNRGEVELLNLAYQEGKKIGQPELLQILMMNETVVGRWGRYGDDHFKDWRLHCFGIMQMQFRTARWIVDKWTDYKLSDKELVKRLRFDDAFAIELSRVMVQYYLIPYFGDNLPKLILSYNTGPGVVLKHGLSYDPNKYLKRGLSSLKRFIIPFNQKQGNGTIVDYKIRPGDTYYKIAANVLCDGNRWREIYSLNPDSKPTQLVVGETLLIWR